MCHGMRCNNNAGETLALPHAVFRFDTFGAIKPNKQRFEFSEDIPVRYICDV